MKSKKEIVELLGKKFSFFEISEDNIDVKSLVNFSFENVETEAEELPLLLQYFGYQQARALRKLKDAEVNFKIWYAKKDRQLRIKKDAKNKKYTEAQISAELTSNPEFLEMKKAIHDAEEQYEIIKSVYWAIQNKSEIVMEILKQKSSSYIKQK